MKLVLYYVNTNSYTKFDANILKDDREVFKQKKISGVQLGQTQLKSNLIGVYYVKTNSYIKFQVNITIGGREKSGKLNFSKGK